MVCGARGAFFFSSISSATQAHLALRTRSEKKKHGDFSARQAGAARSGWQTEGGEGEDRWDAAGGTLPLWGWAVGAARGWLSASRRPWVQGFG